MKNMKTVDDLLEALAEAQYILTVVLNSDIWESVLKKLNDNKSESALDASIGNIESITDKIRDSYTD